jgi:hypothetical protein
MPMEFMVGRAPVELTNFASVIDNRQITRR